VVYRAGQQEVAKLSLGIVSHRRLASSPFTFQVFHYISKIVSMASMFDPHDTEDSYLQNIVFHLSLLV
jgi:hypothetical protein